MELAQEHEWLAKLAGEWSFETVTSMGPDQPSKGFEGTESVRMLGGLWMLGEGRGTFASGEVMTSLMTLGYDPAQKRFVGSYVASFMTHLWFYDSGSLDESGSTLMLTAEGPSMADDGKMSRYRDVIRIEGPDYRTMTAGVLGENGTWDDFMVTHYRRR